jgi:hypothetical protein
VEVLLTVLSLIELSILLPIGYGIYYHFKNRETLRFVRTKWHYYAFTFLLISLSIRLGMWIHGDPTVFIKIIDRVVFIGWGAYAWLDHIEEKKVIQEN